MSLKLPDCQIKPASSEQSYMLFHLHSLSFAVVKRRIFIIFSDSVSSLEAISGFKLEIDIVQNIKAEKTNQTEDLPKRIKEFEMRVLKAEASANTKTSANRPDEHSSCANTRQPVNVFWGCSDPGHCLWQCRKLSKADEKKCDKRIQKVRPIADYSAATCIIVRRKGKSMKALIDTGSDITTAGSRIAKKYWWKVRTSELK